MIGWTIFLVVLWLIWFWAVKRWVFPKNTTERDLLIDAFNRLSAGTSRPPKGSGNERMPSLLLEMFLEIFPNFWVGHP